MCAVSLVAIVSLIGEWIVENITIITKCICCALLDYSHRLQKHNEYLSSHLECFASGLLNELLTLKVLSAAQVEDIKSQSGEKKQNNKLVELMCEKTDYNQHEEFLVSLWTTNQAHLTRYIIKGGRSK